MHLLTAPPRPPFCGGGVEGSRGRPSPARRSAARPGGVRRGSAEFGPARQRSAALGCSALGWLSGSAACWRRGAAWRARRDGEADGGADRAGGSIHQRRPRPRARSAGCEGSAGESRAWVWGGDCGPRRERACVGAGCGGKGPARGGREACTGNGPCRAGGVVLRVLWIFPLRCVPKAAFHLVLCFPDLWALILCSRFSPHRV